jgi:hypothetical protein
MALVTLTEAKAHCRIVNTLEDDLVTLYIAAAEDWIKNFLNQQDIPQEYAVKAAALLIIAGLYDNRSDKITGTIVSPNPAVDSLLFPYRVNMGI